MIYPSSEIHPTAKIHPTAVIYPGVKIGKNVEIGAHCIIGARAESLNHWNDPELFSVIIHDNVILNGLNTVDAGTVKDTEIHSGAFIMKSVHIGHDCEIGEDVIISPHAVIGGHVSIGTGTNIGMSAVIHQRVIVPGGCMIGMNSTITKKTELWSKGVYIGNPARFLRWNDQKK